MRRAIFDAGGLRCTTISWPIAAVKYVGRAVHPLVGLSLPSSMLSGDEVHSRHDSRSRGLVCDATNEQHARCSTVAY